MRQILTYTNLDINGTDEVLFTAGQQGLIFTQCRYSGLTLKLKTPDGSFMTLNGDLTGSGLGFGHSLCATGTGEITTTFYGELSEYYRIIDSNQLQVIVGYPIPFGNSGTVGSTEVVSGQSTWIPQGLYTDKSYFMTDNVISW